MKRGITLLVAIATMVACTQQNKMNESTEGEDTAVTQDVLPTWEATLFFKGDDLLGEGAIWNHKANQFWYIDIDGKKLQVLDPVTKEQRDYQLNEKIGTVVPTSGNRAVVALESSLSYLDLDTEELELIFNPNEGLVDMRSNDGKCDPMGRLWFGSMHKKSPDKNGTLYRVQSDGDIKVMLDSVSISNGIVWSLDSTRLYYTDTPNGYLRVFDYDAVSGDITNETKVGDFAKYGYPDGSTLDAEGMLWVCMWNGGKVLRM
ncbi:MAG: SMP-30/gluconolactonase/LRE family protein, partial [Reichenbachiella sp.]